MAFPLGSKIRKLLFGNPFGEVFPPRPNPPPLAEDGRTVALNILGDYIAALTFFRKMAPGKAPEPFQIPRDNFFIEWPDGVQTLPFPSISVVHDRCKYDPIGLTTYLEEESRDRFGIGTAIQWQSEYQETVQLELWCNERSERRAVIAGIETAMSPTEQMSGLRFVMDDYFGELVNFSLDDREVQDTRDSALKRRKAQIGISMRFNIVALVNYVEMRPVLKTNVGQDIDTGIEVDLEGDDDAVRVTQP